LRIRRKKEIGAIESRMGLREFGGERLFTFGPLPSADQMQDRRECREKDETDQDSEAGGIVAGRVAAEERNKGLGAESGVRRQDRDRRKKAPSSNSTDAEGSPASMSRIRFIQRAPRPGCPAQSLAPKNLGAPFQSTRWTRMQTDSRSPPPRGPNHPNLALCAHG
jgi:hypothetical protein